MKDASPETSIPMKRSSNPYVHNSENLYSKMVRRDVQDYDRHGQAASRLLDKLGVSPSVVRGVVFDEISFVLKYVDARIIVFHADGNPQAMPALWVGCTGEFASSENRRLPQYSHSPFEDPTPSSTDNALPKDLRQAYQGCSANQ